MSGAVHDGSRFSGDTRRGPDGSKRYDVSLGDWTTLELERELERQGTPGGPTTWQAARINEELDYRASEDRL